MWCPFFTNLRVRSNITDKAKQLIDSRFFADPAKAYDCKESISGSTVVAA